MRYRVQLFQDDGTLMVDVLFRRHAGEYWECELGQHLIAETPDDKIFSFEVRENVPHVRP